MPARFQLTPRAFADIENIWNFIAKDSPEAADRVQDAILAACQRLAKNPSIGSRRPGLKIAARVRFWTVPRFPNYLVAYYPDNKPVRIVAILHGKRELRRALRDRGSAPS